MKQFLNQEQAITNLPEGAEREVEEEKEQEFSEEEEEELPPSQRDLKPHKDKGLKINDEDLELMKKSRLQKELPAGQRAKKKKKKRIAH